MDNRLHPLRASQRLLTYLVCGLIAWQPLLPAISATINPVTSGTNMDKAANGVPVVNIATPNSAGISHNQFKDYNVGKEGLILNNATGQLNKTQLGGYIQNNTNLTAGREAKGIINEVTGGSRSLLQGYTEVAGKAANVIVANPYGITCSGCGFINTPNATLTTGKPVFDAKGNLQSLDVSKGTITVEGQGLDASQSDALSIISRATEVNAAIHAKDLKVVAGANRVGSDGSVTAIAGEGAAPVVAVDTGALGGMYANRIHLVSGENGVGVNLGNLNARQGDITLDANGKLVLNNSLSSGALTVKADSAELGGDNKASGAATVTAQNGIALNSGSLVSDKTVALDGGKHVQLSGAQVTAGEDIRLAGAELNIDKNSTADAAGDIGLTAKRTALKAQSDATIAAAQTTLTANSSLNLQDSQSMPNSGSVSADAQGDVSDAAGQTAGKLNNAGQLTAGKGLTLQADSADNSGSLVAKGALSAKAKQLTNSGKLVGDTLETDSDTLDNRGEMLAGKKLKITASTVKQGGTVSAKGNAEITARDSLENKAGGSISSDNGLVVKTAQLNNSGTLSASQLGLESSAISNAGLLQGTQSLSLLGDSLDNQKSGSIATAGDLALDLPDFTSSGLLSAGGALHLSGERLTNSGEINAASLTSDNSTLNNLAGGKLLATGAMQLTNAQLDNAGQIAADGLAVSATTLTNNGGIQGTNGLSLQADTLTNRNGGELLTGGKLTLNSGELANDGLVQGGTLDVTADNWRNGGNALSAQDATVNVNNTLTNSGKILGQQKLDVAAASTDNSGWLAAQVLTLHSDLVNSGLLQGTDGLTLQGSTLTSNIGGQILTSGKATVTAATLDNSGTLQADTLVLNAQTLTNRGQWTANNLSLKGGSLDNGGAVNAISSLTAQLTGKLTQQQNKTLQSGGLLTLRASELDNRGRLQGSTVQLDGGTLTNSGWLQATDLILNVAKAGNTGTWLAEQQATLTGDILTNSGTVQADKLTADYRQMTNNGTLLGKNELTLTGGQINQQAAGKLFSGGNLALTSNGFDQLGQVVALGNATLKLAESLTSDGTIAAGKTLDITSGGALTSNGVMQGETVALKVTGALTNGGQVTGGSGALTLNGGSITSSGSVQGGGDMTFTSNSDITLNGFTGAGGTVTLNAPGTILNTALMYAANNLYLLADKIHNRGGDVLAGNSLRMQRDAAGNANTEIVNSSGTIETQSGDITINTGHLLNTREGLAVSETQQQLNTISGMGNATLSIPLASMPNGSYGYFTTSVTRESGGGCAGADGACTSYTVTTYHYAPYKEYVTRKLAYTQRQVDVTSNGGAARIASGRNLTIHAGNLDNQASSILANNVINISGNQLNNQSWQAGTEIDYLVYQYGNGTKYAVPLTGWLGQQQQMDSLPGNPRKIINYNFVERQSEFTPGTLYRSVIQAGDAVTANFTNDIGNTTTTAFGGRVSTTLTTPSLAAVSSQNIAGGLQAISLGETPAQDIGENLYSGVQTLEALREQLQSQQKQSVDISAYPLPASNDGYFVTSSDPASPYLITLNPKLDGVGKLDPALYGDLYALLGQQPGAAPQETRSEYTDRSQFLGSSYLLGRLNLNPEYDYRFLGDAAFDTRYVSNAVLNQTGNRYLNGIGSELEQMRYLMDNAANAQNSLGLQFGVSLSADQVAALTQSIIWWETATINGETVLVPKLYLAASDTKVNQGSVIAGDNIQLAAGSLTNDGSTLNAAKALTADSQDSIRNLNSGKITAQDKLQLSALKDIDNISSDISGGHVALQSQTGNINNITDATLSQLGKNRFGSYNVTDTFLGHQASITSTDSLTLDAGKDIRLQGAALQSGGNLVMAAGGDIDVLANQLQEGRNATGTLFSGFLRVKEAVTDSTQSTGYQKSSVTSGGNLVIDAGNDLAVSASNISAQQAAALRAGGNLSVTAEQTSDSSQQLKSRNFRPEATRSSLTGVESASVSAGSDVSLLAGNNLSVNASNVNAGKTASLSAGNDLSLDAQATSKTSSRGGSESHSSGVAQTTLTSGENLTLTAGRDLSSQAAAVKAGDNVAVQAGRDIDLEAQATNSGNSYRSGDLTQIKESVRQQGTSIEGGGNVAIVAGRDLTTNAAQLKAKQDLAVAAGNNIDLNTATESDYAYREEIKTKKGFLSKTTTHTISERSSTNEAGTLLSGDNIRVQAGNDLLVQGSAIAGEGDVVLKAGNDVSVKAAIEKSSHYDMSSTKKSGVFSGGGLGITIGSQSSKLERKGSAITESQSHSLVGTTGGNLIVEAGNHVTLRAADLAAARVEGDTTRATGHIDVTGSDIAIIAGQDIIHESVSQSSKSKGLTISFSDPLINSLQNLRDIFKSNASGTTKVQQTAGEVSAFVGDLATNGGMSSLPLTWGQSSSNSKTDLYGEYQTASSLNAAGNVQLNATGNKGQGNALVEGSRVGAGEAVIIEAKDNIAIVASTDKERVTSEASSSGWSITDAMPTYGSAVRAVSGGPNHGSKVLPFALDNADHQGDTLTHAQTSSQITGQEIYINSREGHVDVSGSSLAAINDLMLSAEKGNITVTTGNNSVLDKQSGSQTTVGELGGDGYTGTVGWRNEKYSSVADSNQQSTLRSQIVSQNGNIALQAAQDVAVNGADISAGKSLQLSGENVRLDVSEDRLHNTSESSSTQYGVKASTSGWAVSAVQALETAARSTEEGRDPRLTAIYAAQAALNIATQTMQNNMNASVVKVTVSATAGTSKQQQDYQSQQQQGSTLKADESVIIRADQDIAGQGVDIAGKNVILDAGRDISLTAAQDTEKQNNSSSGSQVGVGVGFSLGGSQNGFTGELGASTSSSRENGTGLVNHNSKVTAQDTLSVTSGRDTTLKGAELSGGSVVANIGRDLTITSLQDAATWDSRQSSGGFNASICIPPFCVGQVVQGSANYSAQNLNNNYQSVVDQSGIYAGSGGFNITVGEHTQLDGAVIASDASADKNHLSTGSLGWSDINNQAKWSGKEVSVSASTNGMPTTGAGMAKDDKTSTTGSAVAPGTIDIRNPDAQTQDIAELSRDTDSAHHALENNFDADKVRDSLEIQKEATALGIQALDAYKSSKMREAAEKNAELKAELAAKEGNQGLTQEQLDAKVQADPRYIDGDKQYGVGSQFWTTGTAVTGLLAGVLGGNVQGGVAAGAAPFLAGLVKAATLEDKNDSAAAKAAKQAANIALHGLVSAALAQAQGANALGAAAGGMTAAALSNALAQKLYGKNADDLKGNERDTLSTLVTLMGSATGLAAGGDGFSAASGANAARVEVENNTLGLFLQGGKLAVQGCAKVSVCRSALVERGLGSLLGIGTAVAVLDKLSDADKEYVLGVAATGRADLIEKLTPEQRAAYDYMVAQDQKGLITIFPQPDRELTGGNLVNPVQEQNKGTTLVTPNQSDINNYLITISPETQPGKNDGIFISPQPKENSGSGYISESSDKNITIDAGDFFKGATYTDKVKGQASSGDFHSFPESVDSYAGQGKISTITGGDGVERLKLEISGEYRGKEGVFEYIREPNGTINHRLFVPKK